MQRQFSKITVFAHNIQNMCDIDAARVCVCVLCLFIEKSGNVICRLCWIFQLALLGIIAGWLAVLSTRLSNHLILDARRSAVVVVVQVLFQFFTQSACGFLNSFYALHIGVYRRECSQQQNANGVYITKVPSNT